MTLLPSTQLQHSVSMEVLPHTFYPEVEILPKFSSSILQVDGVPKVPIKAHSKVSIQGQKPQEEAQLFSRKSPQCNLEFSQTIQKITSRTGKKYTFTTVMDLDFKVPDNNQFSTKIDSFTSEVTISRLRGLRILKVCLGCLQRLKKW